jgi:hypothetical protein
VALRKELEADCVKGVYISDWFSMKLPGSRRVLTFRESMPEHLIHKETVSPSGDELAFEGTFSGPLHSASFELRLKREDGARWRVASFLPAYRGIGLSPAPSLGKELDGKVIAGLRDELAKKGLSGERVGIVALALGSHGESASDSLPAMIKFLGDIVTYAESLKEPDKGYLWHPHFDNLTALTVAIGNIGPPAGKHVPDLLKVIAVKGDVVRVGGSSPYDYRRACSQHRVALAVALGKIGGDEALRALKVLADGDDQPNVRRAAAAALKRLLAAKKDKK